MPDTEDGKRPGFWARQFAPEGTSSQVLFDFLFGFFLPIICIVFDPIVFRGGFAFGGGLLADYRIPAYVFMSLAMLSLAFWLASGRLALFFAGPFLVSGLVALGLGVLLLPLSLPMSLIGIGLLGLVPFVTGFVYLRNGLRAERIAVRTTSGSVAMLVGLSTVLIALGVPASAHGYVTSTIDQAMEDVTSDDVEVRREGTATLQRAASAVPGLVNLDALVWRYDRERDPVKRKRLADAYAAATGDDIAHRLSWLKD